MFTFFLTEPIVGTVLRFSAYTIDATCCACFSIPAGKIILAVSELICRHFREGGLPPNSWALLCKQKKDSITMTAKQVTRMVFEELSIYCRFTPSLCRYA